MGALMPSSRYLADLMVVDINPGSRVIELGAGTGVVTQTILDAGVAPQDLFVIEKNEEFAELLRERFPNITVITTNALSLRWHNSEFVESVDYVLSGMPLLFLPAKSKFRLLFQIFSVLRPDGAFYQFTYGGRCPVEPSLLRRLDLEASLLGVTLLNLPPAFVYRIQKR